MLPALIAVGVAIGLANPAAAAPGDAKPQPGKGAADTHTVLLPPPTSEMGTQASGGSGRSQDFTGDGVPDILAVSYGELYVYPNGGKFSGTDTYPNRVWVNSGWGGFSWVGAADMSGDGFADVVAVDNNGIMYVAEHSGTFNGTSTFKPGLVVINSGWNINDLVFVYDYDNDGYDDLWGLDRSTGITSVYYNTGGISGTGTLQAPIPVVGGGQYDWFQGIADITLDGVPDFIFVSYDDMYVFSLDGPGDGGWLGAGWSNLYPLSLTDLDGNGVTDIIGKRWWDSTLQAYEHSGTWAPGGWTAGTYRAPVTVGYGWDIIHTFS